MPVQRSVRVLPAAGSINTGAPPALLADNEYQDLLNYYAFGGRLVRRGGSRRLNALAFPEQITRLYPFIDSESGWHMVIGSKTGVSYMNDDFVIHTPTPPSSGGSQASAEMVPDDPTIESLEPWGVATRNDIAYLFRSDRRPLRLDVGATGAAGSLSWAGVSKPAAPVLADGGAGTLPAATWRGVIVFYTKTGNHSAYSDVSNALVLGANKKVAWNWTVPTDGAVTQVGLFRTLPDQTGAYYRVALVAASLGTYLEDVAVESMGAAAVSGITVPQRNWRHPVAWKNRLWATDGHQVFPSQFLLYETFNLAYGLAVAPADGADIVGLYPDNDRLYLLKENGSYYLTGDGPSSWAIHELDRKHGSVAGLGVGSKTGVLVFPGWDSLYISAGAAPKPLLEVNTREIFRQMDMGRRQEFQSAVSDEEDIYILIPRWPAADVAAEPLFHRRALVYSFRTNTITTFRLDLVSAELDQPVEIDAVAAGIGPDLQPGMWVAVQGYAAGNPTGNWYILTFMDNWPWDDVGDPAACNSTIPETCGTTHRPILTRLKSKNFGAEGASLVGLLRLWLMTSQGVTRGATISAIPSTSSGMSATRTVDLPGNRNWQAYSLPTRQSPADAVAIMLETQTEPRTDIDGFMVELVDIYRASRAK